ncbi:MAG TPA: YIP1 family protein [Aquimonas sp.]|nr:YIP1 family protein [Xanthomonadales bacterium]HRD74228.1 YIP1 family protein [Aquimonas sp.]HRF54649.1 YIP1 family protein [Aquimonas sp.]
MSTPVTTGSASAVQALVDIFLAPRALFTALPTHRRWTWLALGLLVLFQVASVYTFFGPMSPEWLVDQQLASADIPENQMAQAKATMLQVAPYTAHIGAAMGVVGTVVIAALVALILFAGERVLVPSRQSYGQWYAVTIWAQMPMLLSALGLIVLSLLAASPDQPLSVANWASLNELILGLPIGDAWYGWTEAFSLFFIWTIALVAIATRTAKAVAWPRALLLGSLPYVLTFGIWAIFV